VVLRFYNQTISFSKKHNCLIPFYSIDKKGKNLPGDIKAKRD